MSGLSQSPNWFNNWVYYLTG